MRGAAEPSASGQHYTTSDVRASRRPKAHGRWRRAGDAQAGRRYGDANKFHGASGARNRSFSSCEVVRREIERTRDQQQVHDAQLRGRSAAGPSACRPILGLGAPGTGPTRLAPYLDIGYRHHHFRPRTTRSRSRGSRTRVHRLPIRARVTSSPGGMPGLRRRLIKGADHGFSRCRLDRRLDFRLLAGGNVVRAPAFHNGILIAADIRDDQRPSVRRPEFVPPRTQGWSRPSQMPTVQADNPDEGPSTPDRGGQARPATHFGRVSSDDWGSRRDWRSASPRRVPRPMSAMETWSMPVAVARKAEGAIAAEAPLHATEVCHTASGLNRRALVGTARKRPLGTHHCGRLP